MLKRSEVAYDVLLEIPRENTKTADILETVKSSLSEASTSGEGGQG